MVVAVVTGGDDVDDAAGDAGADAAFGGAVAHGLAHVEIHGDQVVAVGIVGPSVVGDIAFDGTAAPFVAGGEAEGVGGGGEGGEAFGAEGDGVGEDAGIDEGADDAVGGEFSVGGDAADAFAVVAIGDDEAGDGGAVVGGAAEVEGWGGVETFGVDGGGGLVAVEEVAVFPGQDIEHVEVLMHGIDLSAVVDEADFDAGAVDGGAGGAEEVPGGDDVEVDDGLEVAGVEFGDDGVDEGGEVFVFVDGGDGDGDLEAGGVFIEIPLEGLGGAGGEQGAGAGGDGFIGAVGEDADVVGGGAGGEEGVVGDVGGVDLLAEEDLGFEDAGDGLEGFGGGDGGGGVGEFEDVVEGEVGDLLHGLGLDGEADGGGVDAFVEGDADAVGDDAAVVFGGRAVFGVGDEVEFFASAAEVVGGLLDIAEVGFSGDGDAAMAVWGGELEFVGGDAEGGGAASIFEGVAAVEAEFRLGEGASCQGVDWEQEGEEQQEGSRLHNAFVNTGHGSQ